MSRELTTVLGEVNRLSDELLENGGFEYLGDAFSRLKAPIDTSKPRWKHDLADRLLDVDETDLPDDLRDAIGAAQLRLAHLLRMDHGIFEDEYQ